MAILKCKMCGGDVLPSPDRPLGTCQSCGTLSTLPQVDDEQRAGWFNRGNSLRMRGEFDKAADVFEKIILEDNADAEAHWCLMLCRYGIEYVKDPTTHERILTCHRVSLAPASLDVDYLAAIEHADPSARRLYEREAKRIDEVRKAILVVSSNEKPFDVFICYKDTSDSGSRTRDSVLAQDIYQALTADGLRVFFSRITLEDKLGTQYEPYIFAALNSAKVMLVVGTSKENFNAVWVKNEWSRFLALMKKDRSRMLFPCYRDMDPYELPDELAMLQSQDMGKIGFLQDLIRGVKKICRPEGSAPSSYAAAPAAIVSENTDSLLERAYLCLSDGDFGKAGELLERVLDKNPKSAQAYLGKLMIDRHSKHEKALICTGKPLSDNTNYIHALEFADKDLRQRLEGYNSSILEQNRQWRLKHDELQSEIDSKNSKLSDKNHKADEIKIQLNELGPTQMGYKVRPIIIKFFISITIFLIGLYYGPIYIAHGQFSPLLGNGLFMTFGGGIATLAYSLKTIRALIYKKQTESAKEKCEPFESNLSKLYKEISEDQETISTLQASLVAWDKKHNKLCANEVPYDHVQQI